MSVGSIIGGGIGLVRRKPGTIAVWAAIYVVVALVSMRVFQPVALQMAVFQQQIAANAAAGIRTPPAMPSKAFEIIFLFEFIAAILGVVALAAVIRAVAWPARDRFAYLRLGMDELRLIAIAFLAFIAAFVIEIVAILALVLIGLLVGLVLGKAAGFAVGTVLALLLIPVAIYLEVRISLVAPFTVLRRRITIGPAWRATKGRFWTLFGAYVVLTLVFVTLSLIVFALTNPGLLAAYLSFDRQAVDVAIQKQLARQAAGLPFAMLIPMLLGSILFVAMGAVGIGSIATAAIEYGALDEQGV